MLHKASEEQLTGEATSQASVNDLDIDLKVFFILGICQMSSHFRLIDQDMFRKTGLAL